MCACRHVWTHTHTHTHIQEDDFYSREKLGSGAWDDVHIVYDGMHTYTHTYIQEDDVSSREKLGSGAWDDAMMARMDTHIHTHIHTYTQEDDFAHERSWAVARGMMPAPSVIVPSGVIPKVSWRPTIVCVLPVFCSDVCVYVCIYVCMYICMHACMYIRMYVY
jgi:hypothetical protein